MGESALGYWLVVAIFAAVLAALMSTADSALLSISSMLTKDIYLPYFRPQATEAELTKVGKISSWVIVVLLVAVAIGTKATLVRLAGAEVRGLDPGRAVLFPRAVLEAAFGADGANRHGLRAGGGTGVDLGGQTDDLGLPRRGDWSWRQHGDLCHRHLVQTGDIID